MMQSCEEIIIITLENIKHLQLDLKLIIPIIINLIRKYFTYYLYFFIVELIAFSVNLV